MELENTKEEQLTIDEFIIPSNIEGHDMMRLSPLLKFDFYDLSRKGIPIKRVIISEGIRELPIKCFYGIDNIETVILPTTCHDITPSCFELSSIRRVISSDNVCVIGEKAFKSSSINHFDWPASCEKIPFKCFWGPSLVDISFRGDITTIYKGAFACSTIEKFVWPEKCKSSQTVALQCVENFLISNSRHTLRNYIFQLSGHVLPFLKLIFPLRGI